MYFISQSFSLPLLNEAKLVVQQKIRREDGPSGTLEIANFRMTPFVLRVIILSIFYCKNITLYSWQI